MTSLKKILQYISKNLFYFIFISIFLGLANLKFYGGYEFSATICFLAALIMITPSLIPLNFNSLKKIPNKNNTDKKTIFLTIFFNFLISPLLAFIIGKIFFSENKELFLGLLLLSLLPGGGMITTWALNSKAKMSLIVKIIFYNLFFAALLIPIFTKNFIPVIKQENEVTINNNTTKNTLGIDFDKIFKENKDTESIIDVVNEKTGLNKESGCILSKMSGGYITCGQSNNPLSNILPVIFTIIIFPLLFSLLLQKIFIKKYGEEKFNINKQYFGYFSNIGLVIILFIIMSFKNNLIIFERPQLFFNSIIPIFIFYASIFLSSFTIYNTFFKKNKSSGISFFWGSTLRYLTLALAFVSAISITDQNYTIIIILIVISFMIQIPLSYFFSKYFKNAEKK